jgi:hypothetical protein
MTEIQSIEKYVQQLRWALRPLPTEDRDDIVREIRGHLRERAEAGTPWSYERITGELGSPEDYAREFLDNYEITAALASRSTQAMMSQTLRLLTKGVKGFFGGLGLFVLFAFSVSSVFIGLIKPIFPGNVGMWRHDGGDLTLGYLDTPPEGGEEILGYWIVPLMLVVGVLSYIVAVWLMRHFLRSFRRDRRAG